ncbi:MAG: RNA polymerase sigma factor [Verrucomicrobiales bacterium]|nr:RNA polymerase sigma factor [Verrucomicrobiales bacterium]
MDAAAPDRELVGAYAREGSEAAFRSLVARHVNLVYATAFRQLGDSGMAEEVTQNVFVALARKAPRLVGYETLAGWLHRTAILEAKARIRSELRRRRREDVAATLDTVHANLAASPETDLSPLLDEALLHLRDADRVALVMRYLEDRSLREVGASLGIAEDAARKRVSRALERVTEFFRVRGFEVPAAGGAVVLAQAGAQAAPAGLVATAASAGVAAGGAATGIQLLLFQIMSLTKTQAVILGALVVALPWAWQEHSLGALRGADARLAVTESATLVRVSDLEAETARVRGGLERLRASVGEATSRVATLNSTLAARPTPKPYQWSDAASLVRVPKEFLKVLPFRGVENLRGELSSMVKTALHFTESESASVQGAVHRFLDRYDGAVARAIRPVEPGEEELRGNEVGSVRTYEVKGIQDVVARAREDLVAELGMLLDPERAKIFIESLGSWLPLNDEDLSVSSERAIYPGDHRFWFAPNSNSDPAAPSLRYGVSQAGRFAITAPMAVSDIPPYLRAELQDWIQAASQPRPAAVSGLPGATGVDAGAGDPLPAPSPVPGQP